MDGEDRAESATQGDERVQLGALLRATLESTTDGLLAVDRSGRFIDFNQRFVQMWRLPGPIVETRDDCRALAFVLDQLIDPQAFLDKVRTLYAQPDVCSHDLLHFKDGRVFERYSQPLLVTGRDHGRVWSFRDVSDRHRAEQERERSQRQYQELVDSLDGIVWEIDLKDMRFTVVSKQAERLLGYPLGRWLDEPTFWQDIMHPDDRSWAVDYCAEQTALLKDHQFEYRLIAADGRIVWLRDLCSVVVEGGQAVRLRGVMVDVTEQRRTQEERDRLLREERAQRAAAEAAVSARDEFLSIASHELRTPITSLQLAIQSLLRLAKREQLKDTPPELVENALSVAERQSKRLRRLIDTMLDVSRIQAGRLELEPVQTDLSALAREVARSFNEDFCAAGCTLCLQAGAPVVGTWDPGRIEQVISTLLSNAIKYGAGREVRLSVEDLGDRARLVVEDHGIGIAPERHEQIFERFERAVSARHYGGLGLGLYITRLLVQAHGGTIEVRSSPWAGATFTVDLPRDRRTECEG